MTDSRYSDRTNGKWRFENKLYYSHTFATKELEHSLPHSFSLHTSLLMTCNQIDPFFDKSNSQIPTLSSSLCHSLRLSPQLSVRPSPIMTNINAFISSLPLHSRTSLPNVHSCKRNTRPLRMQPCARLSRAQIPMLLTYSRLAAIPLLTALSLSPVSLHQSLLSSALFAAASITDFFDGYLARRWNVISPLGTFLDPVADKLMVAVALVTISARLSHPIIILSTAIIVSREIFVSALREWMALLGKSANVKVSVWGKIKTTVQMLSLVVLLAATTTTVWYAQVGICLLALAAVLAVASASDYTFSAMRAVSSSS